MSRGRACLFHPSCHVCYWWSGQDCHCHLQKASFLPLYKMGPTLQQSYGLAMLQALVLPTSFCHPLHSRVPILMWPSYKSHIDFYWPSGVRISLCPTFLDNSPICTIVLSLTGCLISQTSAIMLVIVYVHMHCLFISVWHVKKKSLNQWRTMVPALINAQIIFSYLWLLYGDAHMEAIHHWD